MVNEQNENVLGCIINEGAYKRRLKQQSKHHNHNIVGTSTERIFFHEPL